MIPGVYKGAPLKIPADDWRIVQQMVAEYRTRGAIGSNGGFRFATPKATPPHPWQIIKAGGLDVNMVDGILFSSAVTTAYSVPQSVTTATITLPNNATTKIWFKAEVSNTPWATFFALWKVDAVTVETGEDLPEDTLDLSDLAEGAGNVFVEIAEVTTADGEVTAITQLLTEPYTLIFPLAIDVGPFECPPEEEEE